MDVELLLDCAFLTLDVCVFTFAYKQYKKYAKSLKSLQEAPCYDIDSNLLKDAHESNGLPYVVISGNIKALSSPLQSQFIPHLHGVVKEKITREHKVKWSPLLRIWSSVNHELQRSVNCVPFALKGKSNLFQKQLAVEVIEPLTAEELVLPVVYDEFVPHKDTLGDTVFGFFRGERTIGVQEVEKMLCENVVVTAVGKIVIENNKLKIKPPAEGLPYYLCPFSLKMLIGKVSTTIKFYKVLFMISGTISIAVFVYILKNFLSDLKKKITEARKKKQWEEERAKRQMADKSRKEQSNVPKCVVCLENPTEILILECGHACLCFDCSLRVKDNCPVCRNSIERMVPAFWP